MLTTIRSLQTTSKIGEELLYPLVPANCSGFVGVDVSPNHALYWEEYGRPDGEPVLVLHGGPGGGCSPAMSRFFDPDRFRVILFDQRGCGKSIPTVASAGAAIALTGNDTWHLVEDIQKIRAARAIDGEMHLFGGSWGSTLAMVYATKYPQNCANLVLRGIFLGEQADLRYMYQGNAVSFLESPLRITEPGAYIAYPDEWRDFVNIIAPSDRGDMMAAYKAIFDGVTSSEAERGKQLAAALAWSVWEGAISNLVPETENIGKFGDAEFALSFAQIEAHYFMNDLFLEPNYLIENANVLSTIPMHIVHGRFDQACPLLQAYRLVVALRATGVEPASFVITNAGHSAMERDTALALTAIMDSLPLIGSLSDADS